MLWVSHSWCGLQSNTKLRNSRTPTMLLWSLDPIPTSFERPGSHVEMVRCSSVYSEAPCGPLLTRAGSGPKAPTLLPNPLKMWEGRARRREELVQAGL